MWGGDIGRAWGEAERTGQLGGTEMGRKSEREEKGVRREIVIMSTSGRYATVPGGGYLSGEGGECAPCTRARGMALGLHAERY